VAGTVTGGNLIAAHQAAGRFFTAAGIRSFVRIEGEGEPVVLMHGLPASSFLYRKVLPELAARGYRGHAFDWPGLGLAERPTDFRYAFDDLGAFCAAALDALDIERYHLVVHDAGGPLGFEMALRTLPRIRSLTILNTMFELPRLPFPGEIMGRLHPAGVGSPMRSLRVWRKMLQRVGIWDTSVLTDEVVAAWRDLALGDNDGASYLAIMRNVREGHENRAWASVVDARTAAYPVRIAWGGHDPMLSLRRFGWKMLEASGLPSMTVVPGRHFLQEDNAAAVATVIAENAAQGR
jgi:pimeloyl-ACP methyl ester carboxylesterase